MQPLDLQPNQMMQPIQTVYPPQIEQTQVPQSVAAPMKPPVTDNPQQFRGTLLSNIDYSKDDNAKIIQQSLIDTEVLNDIPEKAPKGAPVSDPHDVRMYEELKGKGGNINTQAMQPMPPYMPMSEHFSTKFSLTTNQEFTKYAVLICLSMLVSLPCTQAFIKSITDKLTTNTSAPAFLSGVIIAVIYFPFTKFMI